MSILKVNTGTRSAPVYEEVAGGSGNVVGPASSTDNAVARFDGVTGKQIQDSGCEINDSGELKLGGTLDLNSATRKFNNAAATLLEILGGPSVVNYLQIQAGTAGFGPRLLTVGSDTDIDLRIAPKNDGALAVAARIVIADSATIPPLNVTERSSEPSAPSVGDIYLDDGTDHASSTAGFRRLVSTGPDVWEDIGGGGGGGLSSGDKVARIVRWIPTATLSSHMRMFAGGSTPAERYPVWSFADGADEYIDVELEFDGGYDGTASIEVKAVFSAENDTTGTASIAIAFRRLNHVSEDLDASHTYSFQTASVTCPATQGHTVEHSDAFTNAQADGVQGGEKAWLRLFRDVSGDSGWANDVFLHSVKVVLA